MSERIFEGLNEAQQEAVEAVRGPVAILAGAGTGKTTTITRRIANQVATGSFASNEILAVTFTLKAAKEMKARLERLSVPGVRANTFHAEALGQFRRFSEDQPEILSAKGQILHSIASKLPKPYSFTALRDLAGEIEWAKNRRISARDYAAKLDGHEPPVPVDLMHRVYIEYEKRKRRAGLIDFEDLLEQTLSILQSDDRAMGVVRGRYRAFTVDEYQDVNLLQQSLLDAWVGARDDVCVVGDDYQSIFGFTGATPQYLLRFASRWDHTTVVTLRENYRSTPEVLALANTLVPRLQGSAKVLRPTRAGGPEPIVRDHETGAREVAWIVSEVRRLHDEGVTWEDIAILQRINGRSEDFEEAFAREKIPFQVRDGSFLRRAGARAFTARARKIADDGTPVAEVVARICAELGYDAAGAYGSGDEATRQADLARLIALSREFPGATVAEFLADLAGRFAAEDQGRGVQLMTYHRSKGLEFEAVFLPRMEDKELPFALSTSAEEIAEERRLLYVGITRAKRYLAITYAWSRDNERRSKPRPSPFLDEIKPKHSGQARGPAAVSLETKSKKPKGEGPVWDALKRWRFETAKAAGLPAYIVFADATLAEIARTAPRTHAALRNITGVGPLKMQRYGEQVLDIVRRAAPELAAV
jgi:DNA helicase II / ATP-dependent DNA helicase PcrA